LPDQNIRGSAATLSGTSDLKKFNNATYTKCPVGNLSWNIDADSIVLNSKTNRGKAKNAILNFHGIPVAYSPEVNWVLSGKGTGFLAPSVSKYHDNLSSEKGYNVKIPYFINFDNDQDLLVTLNSLSTRGEVIESKYRQLIYDNKYWKSGRFENTFNFLNNDKLLKKRRWYLQNDLSLSFKNGSSSHLKINRVSDSTYNADIGWALSSATELLSSFNYLFNISGFNSNIYFENEQILSKGSGGYTKEVEVNLSRKFDLDNNLSLAISSSNTNFDHPDPNINQGLRNHLNLKVGKKFETLAYSFEPSISVFSTKYNLQNENVSRSLFGLEFDTHLNLEREFKVNNQNYLQTLTPMAYYAYVPEKEQSNIPNFDTSKKGESFSSLFDINNYTGFDKISNKNTLALGVHTEITNDDNGESIFSFSLGQEIYFNKKKLNSDGFLEEDTETIRGYSNIPMAMDIFINNFTLGNTLIFDPELNKIAKTSSSLKYSNGAKNFINIQYIDDIDDSARLNGAIQISKNNSFFWNLDRNLTNSINNRITMGIANEDCCLAYRFVFFKKHKENNLYDYEKAFELVFKGLASTTPSLKSRIESEIPDYIGDLDNNL